MDECCICYQKYESRTDKIVIIKHSNDDTLAISRKRGHYFHHQCITEWRREHGTCPLDRDPIFRLYTVPEYKIIGLELGLYNYDYRDLLHNLKVNDDVLSQLSSIDEVDKNNRTIAFHACKIGNYNLVVKLLKKGSNFNRPCGRDGFTPLMAAICYYHSKITLKLLSNKTVQDGIMAYDTSGNTAFSYACSLNQHKVIDEFLIRKLATIHQTRYQLDSHRSEYYKLGKRGVDIINKMCQYIKTDQL